MQSTMQASELSSYTKNRFFTDAANFYVWTQKFDSFINSITNKRVNFLQAIFSFDKEWQLSVIEKAELLRHTNNEGLNFGMLVASQGGDGSAQAYLTFLKKLGEAGLPPEYLFNLLTAQDHKGVTLGNYIACNRDHATLLQYLDLLLYLEEHGISIRQLFNLISVGGVNGWHIGRYIARDQNSDSVASFLAWLTHFIERGIAPQEVIQLLRTPNNRCTIGHTIALYQNDEAVQCYLDFLDAFLAKYQHPGEVLSLCCSQTPICQSTLIQVIAHFHHTDCILRCLHLMLMLSKALNRDVVDLLRVKDRDAQNAYDIMVLSQPASALYRLICENVFFGMPGDKKSLANKKDAIFNYIKRLPLDEKKRALENALTPFHPLHEFFDIPRWFKPAEKCRSFERLQKELDELNKMPLSASSMPNKTLTTPVMTTYKSALRTMSQPASMPLTYHMPPVRVTQTQPTQLQPSLPSVQSLYPVSMGGGQFINPRSVPSPSYQPPVSSWQPLLVDKKIVETNLLPPTPSAPVVVETQSVLPPPFTPSVSVSPYGFYASPVPPPASPLPPVTQEMHAVITPARQNAMPSRIKKQPQLAC